ncbi:MAG: hypothetical protein V4691_03305 [Pseudomonadota bacterium]
MTYFPASLPPITAQPLSTTYNNPFSNLLNSNVPPYQTPPIFDRSILPQANNGFYSDWPASSYYNPSSMLQSPLNNNWLNNGLNLGLRSPYYNPSVPQLGAPGTQSSLPYWSMNNVSQNNAALDAALGRYIAAGNAASAPGATVQGVATARINALMASPADKAVVFDAMRSGNVSPNSMLAQVFSDARMAGVDLTSLLSNSASANPTLANLDNQLNTANTAVTSANAAVSSATTLDAWRTAITQLNGAQAQVAQLTRDRANLVLQGYQAQSPVSSSYQLPYQPWQQQLPYQLNW